MQRLFFLSILSWRVLYKLFLTPLIEWVSIHMHLSLLSVLLCSR